MAAASGAIPKRPPPGLQAPPTYVNSAQDIAMAPSAFQAGVGSHDAGTTVMDTVLPGPALAGGVSVSTPAPGYQYGYVRSVRRAEGSSMDIYNQVSACPPAEAAVSAPPIGYFPDSRRCLPTVTQDT